jgi:hypothetical protein
MLAADCWHHVDYGRQLPCPDEHFAALIASHTFGEDEFFA